MTAAVAALRDRYPIAMGVNVHLNGALQALAIAFATGCGWVRVFELANAYVSNAGTIEAAGPRALRYRAALGAAGRVLIFGDFHVKHGSHAITADRSLEDQAEDVQTALADAVIVTGVSTGRPPEEKDLQRIRGRVTLPILIGSGLGVENLDRLLPHTDGAIVGTALKEGGRLERRIDRQRVTRLMEAVRSLRGAE
jgi:membrane complex biogenesis BtpA family protein